MLNFVRFSLNKNFLNLKAHDILYGNLLYYSFLETKGLKISKKYFNDNKNNIINSCNFENSRQLKYHMDKLQKLNLIYESKENDVIFYNIVNYKENSQIISLDMLYLLLKIGGKNLLKTYLILLKESSFCEEDFYFSVNSLSSSIGYSKTQSSDTNFLIKDILKKLSENKILLISDKVIQRNENSGKIIPVKLKLLEKIFYDIKDIPKDILKKYDINIDKVLFSENDSTFKKEKSSGEVKIAKILTKNEISYLSEYSFNDCVDKKRLRFDFAIFNDNNELSHLIEFNGEQHYMTEPKGYFTLEKLEGIRRRDKIKQEYCRKNKIPLIIIHYDKKESLTLEDLLL